MPFRTIASRTIKSTGVTYRFEPLEGETEGKICFVDKGKIETYNLLSVKLPSSGSVDTQPQVNKDGEEHPTFVELNV